MTDPLSLKPFIPRKYYGALLEPENKVLHFGGQHLWWSFIDYWKAMRHKPMGYMTYLDIKYPAEKYFETLKHDMANLENDRSLRPVGLAMNPHLALQVGMGFTWDGKPELHFEGEVAEGKLDKELDAYLTGFQELQRPVYLRLGYECNGTPWNGYEPESFKEAFNRAAQMVKQKNRESVAKGKTANLATVWNLSMDVGGLDDWMKFFPGNEYLDWWSINPFSVNHYDNPDLPAFLELADQAGKPVLLGEITPRYVGTQAGVESWNQWFVRYFNLIHQHPGIKVSAYINWNWGPISRMLGQVWDDWLDARIDSHPLIHQLYEEQMCRAHWLNASCYSELWAALQKRRV